MRARYNYLLTLILVLIVAACSSDNGTAPDADGGGGGGGTPTRSDSLWVADVGSLAEQMEAWADQPPDTIAARALAALRAMPRVADAGIVTGTTTVWATFTNGYDLVIPNNREPSTMADTLVDAASAPQTASAPAPRRVTVPAGGRATSALRQPDSALEIPVSPQFRAVNAIGTCHLNPLPVIKSLLKQGNYTDANPPLPTVDGLRNVSGDGVFYINSHGGAGFDKNRQAYYAVWTLDPINPATVGNYRSMLATHELVGMLEYSNDGAGNCACVMHYGFTDKFVRRRMRFEKNSLVIVDTCHSASAPAAALRSAFRDVGASVYIGWTHSVSPDFAYAAMKYLFDRLLGSNVISPENPKQRAFNIDDVMEDMATRRNLTVDPQYNSVLTVFKLKDDFGLLAPSIQFLSVEERENESRLIIAGMFGTDPGDGKRAIRINGQSLDVITWQTHLIECDVPVGGANAAGTVVVEVGEGSNLRTSNSVNLTEWKGDIIYERDDPGDQNVAMTLRVHFRADIHAFRDMPHEQPWETTVLFGPMRDASASITASGSYVKIDGQCTDTYPLSGSWNQPSPYQTAPEGGWNYLGSVDTQNHELLLHTFALFLVPAARWIRGGAEECGSYDIQLYIGAQIDECLFDDLQGVTAFRIGMEQDFSVPADTRGPWTVPALVAPLAELSGEASIRWSNFTVNYPPDPDAAR